MSRRASTKGAMARKPRLTPKQRVLRRFKNAYAAQGPNNLWAIFGSRFGGRVLYLSHPRRSARVAWLDAFLRHV